MDAILVDDDPLIQSLLREVLQYHQFNVRTYSNAEEAWQAYLEHPVHFVVVDLILPGMSGLDLIKKIRSHDFGDFSYLLVVTMRDQESDLHEVLQAGADDYLTKPIDINLINIRLAIAKQQIRQLVLRRQAELELVKAREAAETASRAKGEFMSVMTHELRTPLNAILGFNDLLTQTTELDQEQLFYCNAIDRASDSLLALISDILDYSRLDIGKTTILSIPFDLELCIQESIDACMKRASISHVEIMVDYQPQLPTRFIGDPQQLRRVLAHLIENALKFTAEGEVLISVSLFARKNDTLFVKLVVRDSGIGISQEKQQQIFNVFTIVDSSLKREHPGSGLGLALTYKLIQAMGGEISLQSSLGEGSSFSVMIPLIEQRQLQHEHEERDLVDMSLLVVAENHNLAHIMQQYATAYGMQVDTVSSASSAMEKMRNHSYDYALLDYDTLLNETAQFWQNLKQNSVNQMIQCVLMCSSACGEITANVKRHISASVYKPVTRSHLLDVLTTLHGGWGESQHYQEPIVPETTASQPLQVLLVEDNVLNRESANRMLSMLNCQVTESVHGLQAIKMIDAQDFDLVFMDIRMPKMDGLEATRRIRLRGGTNSHVPIIALTAESMDEERERCMRAGMDDYINKPLNMADLKAVLDKWRGNQSVN